MFMVLLKLVLFRDPQGHVFVAIQAVMLKDLAHEIFSAMLGQIAF